MSKLEKFGSLAGSNSIDKEDFKIEKNLKYLEIIMTNVNCILFQNNYVKIWNEGKNLCYDRINYNCHCWVD